MECILVNGCCLKYSKSNHKSSKSRGLLVLCILLDALIHLAGKSVWQPVARRYNIVCTIAYLINVTR